MHVLRHLHTLQLVSHKCSQVSQHKECRLRVTVLDATSSLDGGKKVKLLGVMVVENGLGVGDGNTLHELGIRSL